MYCFESIVISADMTKVYTKNTKEVSRVSALWISQIGGLGDHINTVDNGISLLMLQTYAWKKKHGKPIFDFMSLNVL